MPEINKNAREYLLFGNGDTGIVITHGFTSSPSYMRKTAEDMNALGYSVFAPLLPGHGTVESDLRKGTPELWQAAVISAAERLRNEGAANVWCMGHSLGGVVSLLAAERGKCDGVITVAAPMKIYGQSRVRLYSIFKKNDYYTMNKPDGREDMFRYYRADGVAAGNLLRAMKMAKDGLKRITVPTMVIYSHDDKTVKAESSEIIYNGVSSTNKELTEITGDHHQCIVDSRSQYIGKIHKFISENS